MLTAIVAVIITLILLMVNPLSPHDALKHHYTSMKTYLISR